MKIFSIIYDKTLDNEFIKFFDPFFIKNNNKKFRLIINNKISTLISNYKAKDCNTKLLKVKLLLLENHQLNFSKMFSKCSSLIQFYEKTSNVNILKGVSNKVNRFQGTINLNKDNESNIYSNDFNENEITISKDNSNEIISLQVKAEENNIDDYQSQLNNFFSYKTK